MEGRGGSIQAEPIGRLEVFTGVGRRSARTAEKKARSLAESDESGAFFVPVPERIAVKISSTYPLLIQ